MTLNDLETLMTSCPDDWHMALVSDSEGRPDLALIDEIWDERGYFDIPIAQFIVSTRNAMPAFIKMARVVDTCVELLGRGLPIHVGSMKHKLLEMAHDELHKVLEEINHG